MNRSICEMACEVQESGLCTNDWLGTHRTDPDISSRMRNLPAYAGWEKMCAEIENQRHFLFDELPNVQSRGLWPDSTAALMDYAKRIHEPGLTTKVQRLWS